MGAYWALFSLRWRCGLGLLPMFHWPDWESPLRDLLLTGGSVENAFFFYCVGCIQQTATAPEVYFVVIIKGRGRHCREHLNSFSSMRIIALDTDIRT